MKKLRDRDVWQSLVLADPHLSSGTKITLVRVSLHHNFKTGQCNPSYQTLADGTGMKLAAIPKQLKQGEDRGFIRRIGSKGRHSNNYEMLFPAGKPTTDAEPGLTTDRGIWSTADSHTRFEGPNPIQPSTPTTYLSEIEPCTAIHTRNTEPYLNNEENIEELDISPNSIESQFEQFWQQYPRRVDKGSARKAFERVLTKNVTTFDNLMAGVHRYAAERMDEDQKFTKHPTTWLNSESWSNEPLVRAPKPMDARSSAIAGLVSRIGSQDFER